MIDKDGNYLWSTIYDNAVRCPDRVIVKDTDQDWTWKMLFCAGLKYAAAIDSVLELPRDAIIPVFVDRSGYAVAAIVGIILSGRAYAPLSIDQPQERIEKCFKLLKAKVFIETSKNISDVFTGVKRIPRVESYELNEIPSCSVFPKIGKTLYVLFTSGSTGEPKGVLASHGNILNTVLWGQEILDWQADDVIGCATSFFFDISQFDLLTSLYLNIPLAIYSNPENVNKVIEETEQFKITSIFSVPTFFSQLLRCQGLPHPHILSLRRIISGGDFFPPSHVLEWMDNRPDIAIYNAWGPTETSIVNTMHRINKEDRQLFVSGQFASVGEAHPRMFFVLLDEEEKEVTECEARGEICMLGDCVTQGYIDNPDETKQAYFSWNGQPAFKTKDIGWFDDKGRLYILGRKGSTVKISGYRIDLGEVEKAVMMEACVYLARTFVVELQEGVEELWIAVELHNKESEFDIYNFKKRLRQRLPRYMVPKRVIIYNIIPKNANGKIDRRFLTQETQKELRSESAQRV